MGGRRRQGWTVPRVQGGGDGACVLGERRWAASEEAGGMRRGRGGGRGGGGRAWTSLAAGAATMRFSTVTEMGVLRLAYTIAWELEDMALLASHAWPELRTARLSISVHKI